MKKTILYLFTLLVISTAFFACEDPYANQEVAKPTVFDQPAIQDANFQATVKANPLAIAADKLTGTVPFINLTSVPTLVDNTATVEYKVILSNSADFATYKSVATTLSGKDLVASYKQLNDTLKALNPTVSKHPAFARVLAYIVKGGTKALYTTANLPFDVTTYNFPPVAKDDIVVAFKDQMLMYDVLANDSDPEGDAISFADPAIATQPAHGTVMAVGRTIFYTPEAGYVGADKFQYAITDGHNTASAWVNITVTAMKQYFETTVKPWYIVGSMGGWTNNVDAIGSSLIPLSVVEGYKYDDAGNGEFTYTGYFKAADEFILIDVPGSWANKWANDGGKGINKPVKGSGENFKVPEDGYYKIVLNTINNTCTITSITITPTTYTKMGMIGAFNGWADGFEMDLNTSSNGHLWYKTVTFATDGNFLFRADSDWGKKFGAPSPNGNGDPLYQPVGLGVRAGGADILQKAGTYVMVINDIDGCYYAIKK